VNPSRPPSGSGRAAITSAANTASSVATASTPGGAFPSTRSAPAAAPQPPPSTEAGQPPACQARRSVRTSAGVPRSVMLVLDSTVVQRYGLKQAGAEKGYNPAKRGRPSHHPLVAFPGGTGDCLGVRWRPGNAHTAAGAIPWIETRVGQLRAAGVEQITVRLDKGFFSREMAEARSALGVGYVLKVPDPKWLRRRLPAFRRSHEDAAIWTASTRHYGARLLTLEKRREVGGAEGERALESFEVETTAHVLTNVEGISALSAWRLYNRDALVEQRIEELGQLSVRQTEVATTWAANICSGPWGRSPTRCSTRSAPRRCRAPGDARGRSACGPSSSACRRS